MTLIDSTASKLKKYIPGGCHTYSKGDDQWPEIAPKYLVRGEGCWVWDGNGNKFVDWSMGLTSVCLGHAHKRVNEAAINAMALGHNFQRPAKIEADAAEQFIKFLRDRGEMVKFAKNGSTVTTAAVKLARAFTGKLKVAVCGDHPFFSYDDWFIASTKCWAGIPSSAKELTVKFKFNDVASLEAMFGESGSDIAAVILEPIKFEVPTRAFIDRLEDLCRRNEAILILDEMVTGFKWHRRGAGAYYNINADLYTWGKGMANGHSACALTGRRDIMELGGIDHQYPRVFLASSTHGAEIPQLAAMMATLDVFTEDEGLIDRNWKTGRQVREHVSHLIQNAGLASNLRLIGEDCFIALDVTDGGRHPKHVAKTYLLQELIKEGILFQGLFYTTSAHDQEAIETTFRAWEKAIPRFARFLERGDRSELLGAPMKPVFRAFNSCECAKAEDCAKCEEKIRNHLVGLRQ